MSYNSCSDHGKMKRNYEFLKSEFETVQVCVVIMCNITNDIIQLLYVSFHSLYMRQN